MSTAGDREAELTAIGREMFAWLDDAGWASNWADGAGDRELKVRVRRTHDVREIALLEVLWELLARDNGPLALDTLHLFTVARRVSASADAWKPHHGDLQLMFMASAPKGQVELYFERDEAAILAATRGNGRVHLVVAETGALRFLGGRLTSKEGPFEAVHLSYHGDIDNNRGPVLLLEAAECGAKRAGAGAVVQALGAASPPLVVLSAYRTAEAGRSMAAANGVGRRDAATGQRREGAGAEITASFARQLMAQIASVARTAQFMTATRRTSHRPSMANSGAARRYRARRRSPIGRCWKFSGRLTVQ